MSEGKNLDKLFQEKFKDFEATAPEQSWPYIEEQLKKKKKRRVIPFWWQLSGVAAALILGFLIYKNWSSVSSGDQKQEDIVVKDKTNPSDIKGSKSFGNKSSETAVTQAENAAENASAVDLANQESENQKTSGIHSSQGSGNQSSEGIANHEPSNLKKPNFSNSDKIDPGNKPKSNTSQNQIANTERKSGNAMKANPSHQQKNKNAIGVQYSGDQLAVNVTGKRKDKPATGIESDIKSSSQNPNIDDPINTEQNAGQNNSAIAQQNQTSKSETSQNKTTDSDKDIVIATAADKKTDSTAIATVVPNALEELLNEKENNLVTKGPQLNRWQITSSVAPIYFGSTSGGSPIDSSFVSNSKSYKTNMSLKLGVNYAVNKKLSIRTGISQVTLDYNTNDVMMYTGLQSRTMGNVNTSGESQYLHFGKRASRMSSNETLAAAASELSTDKFQSYLNQRMGYIEVPLEISYALIDKKIGFNIIGGVSTLFLNENKILVVSDGLTTNLGEANNLNKTHFSTNIGVGFRYRFYKAFQANFEPMFKYQINTFSKDDGNFKPYYLGLYTGVSYSF